MTVATRLPPAEKLSLVERKNIRDSLDNKIAEYNEDLEKLLGPGWKWDIDPKLLSPYLENTKYKGRAGDVAAGYIEDNLFGLKAQYLYTYKEQGKELLNQIITTKSIGLDVDETGKYDYCGPAVRDGKLFMTFNADKIWSNSNGALAAKPLVKALEAANTESTGGDGLPIASQLAIEQYWKPEFEEIQSDLATVVHNPDIKIVPHFEEVYAKLHAAKDDVPRKDYAEVIAAAAKAYFEGLIQGLKHNKVDKDDMLYEAFNEVVSKNEVGIRVVDKLKGSADSELAVEDGKLWIQFTPKNFFRNVDNCGMKIVEILDEA